MRGRRVAALAVVSAAVGAGVAACFDLFHSTRDVLTACEIDAQTPDCGPPDANGGASDSSEDAKGTDFCLWQVAEARAHALHACAWLGACETPMGRNALGSCLFSALLAYDCRANPNHRVQGKTHQLWDCLWRANSCGDLQHCVFPQGLPQACTSDADSTGCGALGVDGVSTHLDVHTQCSAGGTVLGESCALWGQTCMSNGALHACAGGGGLRNGCIDRGCFGHLPALSEVRWCVDGGDIGLDCASVGQECGLFPDASDARNWVACVTDRDASPCQPDASATCANGVASSCLSGTLEKINCASLLQSDAACVAGRLEPPFDWTGACVVTPPDCDADSCTDEGGLVGCVRGKPFALDCAEAGLATCRIVPADMGSVERAACTPPLMH